MAAGVITLFNIAKEKLADGTFDLDSQTFKVVLCDSSQALSASFAGTSTDCRYADLTGELSTANGYTAGGLTLTTTWTRSSGTMTFDADDAAWTLTGAGITYKYAVIYADNTNDDLLCFFDVDTGGGSISPSAGAHTLQWNASGLFTLS